MEKLKPRQKKFEKAILDKVESLSGELMSLNKEYERLLKTTEKLKKQIKQYLTTHLSSIVKKLLISAKEKKGLFDSIDPKLLQRLDIQSPDELMEFIGLKDIIEQQKYEYYREMLKSNPEGLIHYIDDIKDEPWLDELLKNYLKSIKIRDLLNDKLFESITKTLTKIGQKQLTDELIRRKKMAEKVVTIALKKQIDQIKTNEYYDKLKKQLKDPKNAGFGSVGIDLQLQMIETECNEAKQRFLQDNAIQYFHNISPQWLKHIKDAKKRAEFIIRIARNLYIFNKPINEKTVKQEYNDILLSQKEVGETPVYQSRNIIALFNNEKSEKGKYKFYNPETIAAIRKQGGFLPDENIIIAKNTIKSLKQKKEDFLELVKRTEPPLTCHIEAHGSPSGIYLRGGKIIKGKIEKKETDIKITYEELGQALIDRRINFPNEKTPPILVLFACHNNTYIRNLYSHVKKYTNIPISFGPSEYGQYAYTDPGKYEKVLRMETASMDNPTRLKHIIQNQDIGFANTTLYIPYKGKIKQIVEKGKAPGKKQLKLPGRPPSDETLAA